MAEDSPMTQSGEGSTQEKSPFTAPQISLPKGGGAIRGIGEKFTANAVTGTGSLSTPIALSSGRGGFGPQLSLTYDSGSGNGPFGIGWNLGLPSMLDLELLASLPDGDAKTAGIMVGQIAAQNILAAGANDGSNNVVNYTPGTDPGDWQPTPPAYLLASLPGWGMVTPFCLQNSAQFRPSPPPALTSAEYTAAFNQIKEQPSPKS